MTDNQRLASTDPGDLLPAPTGPYPVGRAAYHWPGATASQREMVAWLWYPAAPSPGAPTAAYLPPGWDAVAKFWGFRANEARSHAYADAPVAPAESRYPVLLFSPAGYPPLSLAAMLEEIASHGYVVVGLNHTGESSITVFPDGREVPMDMELMRPVLGPFSGDGQDAFEARAAIADGKAADLRFALDQLRALDAGADRLSGRLDLDRVGAFGHSLGGNAALEFCRNDESCKAVVNLDGCCWSSVGRVGLEKPVPLLLAEHNEMLRPCAELVGMGVYPTPEFCIGERELTFGGWQRVYERASPSYGALIKGAGHISFMDLPFLPLEPGSMVAGGLAGLSIDARRAWRIICDYVLAFFGRHLHGLPAPLLDGATPDYTEVALGAPRDLFAPPR